MLQLVEFLTFDEKVDMIYNKVNYDSNIYKGNANIEIVFIGLKRLYYYYNI